MRVEHHFQAQQALRGGDEPAYRLVIGDHQHREAVLPVQAPDAQEQAPADREFAQPRGLAERRSDIGDPMHREPALRVMRRRVRNGRAGAVVPPSA